MNEDTQALLALLGDDSRALLLDVAKALTRIEARQAAAVPPDDVRAGVSAATEIVAWTHARMSGDELRVEFEDQAFVTKQLISIMHGTRDDLVLLRADLRELTALLRER